jgi:hypothetical protein
LASAGINPDINKVSYAYLASAALKKILSSKLAKKRGEQKEPAVSRGEILIVARVVTIPVAVLVAAVIGALFTKSADPSFLIFIAVAAAVLGLALGLITSGILILRRNLHSEARQRIN